MSRGIFQRTPHGEKTDLMRQVEARLGRKLEDDYREYYLEKGWGQIRLAKRWGVKRATIFEPSARSRRRSWVQMLGLPTRGGTETSPVRERARATCEACGEASVPLERAHWLPASEGGLSASDNIVLLCPNCHTKLDQIHDPATTERVRAILLFRTARRLLEVKGYTAEQFLMVCRQILAARSSGA